MHPPAPEPVVPFLRVQRIQIRDLSLQEARLHAELALHNPCHQPLDLCDGRWELAVGSGVTLARGEIAPASAIVVPARSSAPVGVACVARFDELPGRLLSDAARAGFAPCTLGVTLHVADAARNLVTLAAAAAAELPLPASPAVTLRALRFDRLGWNRAEGRALVRVANRCAFAVEIEKMDLLVTLDGSTQITASSIGPSALAPGETRDLAAPFAFCPASQGFAAFSRLDRSTTDYQLSARLRCLTPWAAFACDVDHRGHTALARADVPAIHTDPALRSNNELV